MDTQQHLMELAQRFQLSSFDGDISHLSGGSSSSNSSISESDSPERGHAAALDVSGGGASEFSMSSAGASPQIGQQYRRRGPANNEVVSPSPSPAVPSASAAAAAASKSRDRSQSRRDEDLRMRYEQLKKNFKKQGEELDKTTKQYDELKHATTRDRTELTDRVRTLESRLMSAESATRSATLEFEHALKSKTAELASLSSSLRQSQAALADQNPDILKQIDFVKDDLSDLTTSEAMYLEYKAIEPHRQTIREYVCCTVYELIRAERNNKESMARELEMIRTKFIQAEQDAERNARERDQIGKLKKKSDRETELLSDLSHLETLNQKLHDELSKKTMLVQELSSKGEMFDSLLSKSQRIEAELSEARAKDMMQSITLKSLADEKDLNASRLFNLEKSQDLLRQDKLYLSKETERLTESLARANTMLDRADSKNLELKKQKEELVEKLVKVREEHARSYEEKLSVELNRLQSRTASDLESIRTNQREAFEREIAGLKESRDRIAVDYDKAATSLESLKTDHVALQDEQRRLQSTIESERSDARNALKLKVFEYDRLSLSYEELLSDLRKSKTDSEILTKKMSVLKADHYALQAETTKRILELESECKNLQEKLQMYQQLEYELDVAILQAGGLEEGQSIDGSSAGQQQQQGSGGSAGQLRGIHSMLESLGSNIPTANKRRMKQSILLAQQLVAKSRQIEVLSAERTHFQSHNASLETELSSLKQALENVNQPHHYLISHLQQKDAELASLTAQMTALKSELNKREDDLRQALLSKTALEADLHRLIAGRQHLEGIKSAIMHAHQGGGGGGSGSQSQGHAAAAGAQGKAATLDQQWAALQKGIGATGGIKENRPPHSFAADQDRYASLNDPRTHQASMASMSASQGRPTSSFAAHNQHQQQQQPHHSHSASAGGDSSLDAQSKPLWFRKLHH